MGILNWVRGKLCTNKSGHVPVMRYDGMSVIGFKCSICKYHWYEDRKDR